MANAANVEVTDDTVVTVELPEDYEIEATGDVAGAKPGGEEVTAPRKSAADEAAATLTETAKALEDEKRARIAADQNAQAERRRADEATKVAQQKSREANEAKDTVASSQLTIITNGIESANRELAASEAELIAAQEAGDFAKGAKAQTRMAKAAAALDRLEASKQTFEADAVRRAAEPVREPVVSTDPLEDYITAQKFAPAAVRWLRAHPDCAPDFAGGDPTRNAAMMEGHYAATKQGVPSNSAEYFRIIEEAIGERTAEAKVEVRPKPAPRVQASAPASREPPAASGAPARTGTVKLNSLQQEAALFSYPAKPGEDESTHRKRAFGTYANEYVKAQAEGKIGRMTH